MTKRTKAVLIVLCQKAHRYRFCVYGLDCALELPSTSRKKDLVQSMAGHILQRGEITGWYQP